MRENRYFIGVLPKSDMAKVYDIIVGTKDSQRPISKKNKIIIKLPIGDTKKHACLNSFKELTYEQMSKKILEDEFKINEDGV